MPAIVRREEIRRGSAVTLEDVEEDDDGRDQEPRDSSMQEAIF